MCSFARIVIGHFEVFAYSAPMRRREAWALTKACTSVSQPLAKEKSKSFKMSAQRVHGLAKRQRRHRQVVREDQEDGPAPPTAPSSSGVRQNDPLGSRQSGRQVRAMGECGCAGVCYRLRLQSALLGSSRRMWLLKVSRHFWQ